MTLFLIFMLSCCAFFLLLFKYTKAGIITQAVVLLAFLVIGDGLVPFFLLNGLQSPYVSLPDPEWSKRNTIVLLTGEHTKAMISNGSAYARINAAASLYRSCIKSLKQCTILVSGGDVAHRGLSLAENYREELFKLGIPKADIAVETKSMNTYQSAKFTGAMLHKKPLEQVILVTSGYHLKRALVDFNHFGIRPRPISSDILIPGWEVLPRTANFETTDIALHEYLGILQFYLYYFWKASY